MTEHDERQNKEKKTWTLGELLQALYDSFNRSEITLPKAIIIAAALIALGLMFS